MRLAHTLRLIAALLALGFAMAGSAAAAVAMAKRAMPCHDQVQTYGYAEHGMTGLATGGHQAAVHPGAGPESERLNMCCVLSQIVAPLLLAGQDLSHPAPRVAALAMPPAVRLVGRILATPVPPPRAV